MANAPSITPSPLPLSEPAARRLGESTERGVQMPTSRLAGSFETRDE